MIPTMASASKSTPEWKAKNIWKKRVHDSVIMMWAGIFGFIDDEFILAS